MAIIGSIVPGFKLRETVNVTANKITPTGPFTVLVNTSGAAQTLNEIDASSRDGSQIMLGISSNSFGMTAKHNTGTNKMILTGSADLAFTSTTQFLWLEQVSGIWYEIGRFGFPTVDPKLQLPTQQVLLSGDIALTSGVWADVFDLGTLFGDVAIEGIAEFLGTAAGNEYNLRINHATAGVLAGTSRTSSNAIHRCQLAVKYRSSGMASGNVKIQAMCNSTLGVVKYQSNSGYPGSVTSWLWQVS